jgi:alkanesulfonate monooxygenase SsuD/methylene tetrahydromethanopterin reductase-like flavin-dependent oxidoreductase (luciferase family)
VARFKPDELTIGDYMFHLIGTPKECIEKLNMYRDLGISELVLQFPSLGARDLEGLRLFAESVTPVFKGS